MKAATEKLSKLFELIVQAIGSCMFCIVFILCILIMGAGITYLLTPTAVAEDTSAAAENQNASAAENKPAAIECGSCGAHVYEYWYVENINDGTPVEVCRYCYENYIDNTVAENTATEN